MMTEFMAGAVVRYTHYLVPNGAGTRIISCAAPPTSIETGEALPELAGPEYAESFQRNMQETTDRLLALTDATVARQVAAL